jgi:protein-S-isoprenylcysteine O-methyltransferase Ste14
LNWFISVSQSEYSQARRIIVVIVGQVLFLIIFLLFIVVGSSYVGECLHLPRLVYGLVKSTIALLLIVLGGILAEWSVGIQFSLGKGTPIPVVATRRLVVERPYAYYRNPMALGTTAIYLRIAIWVGSLWAVGLASIYPMFIAAYTKLVEGRELEKRFGAEYLECKRKTPFLTPGLRRKA